MRILPRLWQRVFMYAILLVLASHAVSFAVFQLGLVDSLHVRLLEDLASGGSESLQGRSVESAEILPDFFRGPFHELWMERPDGEIVVGEPKPGFTRAERGSFPLAAAPRGNVRILKTGDEEVPYLAAAPVSLTDGEAIFFMYMKKKPAPPLYVLFTQGLIAVCLIGGALSIWAAWRIARPLRKLRAEVLEIADGNLEARVSVKGSEEITQVAEAVNSMARNLSRNITGMRELVANLSHEMRSPLARMNFSVAIVEEGLSALAARYREAPSAEGQSPVILDHEGNPLALRHVLRIVQEIEHMEKLVGSCLLNSKLDFSQERPRTEPLDLSVLCGGIALMYEATLDAGDFSFKREIQDAIIVEGDESLLALVLTNLLDNAAKYTAPGGKVLLSLREENGMALLSLENSHQPLDPEELPRLFEPFYRRPDTAGIMAGAGLGLSLVQKIAALHGGGITAENGEVGLLFTVRLPLGQPREPEE